MLKMTIAAGAIGALSVGTAAASEGYEPITDRSAFLQMLGNKQLSNRLYGINLAVLPDGRIQGTGAGRDVTGEWYWENGFFCRTMAWGDREIPFNCQLVETNGPEMRFTTDQGAGDSASFRLR